MYEDKKVLQSFFFAKAVVEHNVGVGGAVCGPCVAAVLFASNRRQNTSTQGKQSMAERFAPVKQARRNFGHQWGGAGNHGHDL